MSTAENPVSMDIRDGIAVLTLDSPPVNALGHAVRSGLMNALEKAEGDEGVEEEEGGGEGANAADCPRGRGRLWRSHSRSAAGHGG